MATHKKTKSAKGLLRTIRQFFQDPKVPRPEVRAAWAVLTALRGPDADVLSPGGRSECPQFAAKTATTAVIRERVIGKRAADRVGADAFQDSSGLEINRRRIGESHFGSHARRAFEALGLKWDGVNPAGKE